MCIRDRSYTFDLIFLCTTVTVNVVSIFSLSSDFIIISAVPIDNAFTISYSFTLATVESDDVYIKFLFTASSGSIIGFI